MIHKSIDLVVDYKKAGASQDGYQATLCTYIQEESPELIYSKERPAVIICPGGAYRFRSDREAEVVALRYAAAGMQAFVLQYSVAPSCYPSALLELATAVAHVRTHAKEYCVNPDKIIVTGFSAGGHLAACLGNLWNREFVENALKTYYPVEGEKVWKPNGMILAYPVITVGMFAHEESVRLLLGKEPTEEDIKALSMELQVSEDTVPTFIWHTYADETVPVENSLIFALELRKHQIPLEMHIYETGCHGLSLCDDTVDDGTREFPADNKNWIEMAIRWIKRMEA